MSLVLFSAVERENISLTAYDCYRLLQTPFPNVTFVNLQIPLFAVVLLEACKCLSICLLVPSPPSLPPPRYQMSHLPV